MQGVRPLLNVEHRGIVFGHIGLADPADFPLPGQRRLGSKQGSGHCGGRRRDEVASIQVHRCSPVVAGFGPRGPEDVPTD